MRRGLRIQKTLCYALSDVDVSKDNVIVDSRFQTWAKSGDLNEKPFRVFPDFLNWVSEPVNKSVIGNLLEQINGPHEFNWTDLNFSLLSKLRDLGKSKSNPTIVSHSFLSDFVFAPDYGLKNVFGIFPPEETAFSRYGDMIDYYEANGKVNNKVQWLDQRNGICGIYPYGNMIRIPHEPRIKATVGDLDMLHYQNRIESDCSEFPDVLDGRDFVRLIGKCGNKMKPLVSDNLVKKFMRIYRPQIHPSVLLWTWYVGLFTDWARTANQLRPCVYTYWG